MSLDRDTFGEPKRVLGDVQKLFGGDIKKTGRLASLSGLPLERTLTVEDISAGTRTKPSSVNVQVKNLERREAAAKWTALRAYAARGGVQLDHLAMEVEGLRGQQEWHNRREQARNEQAAQDQAAYTAALEVAAHQPTDEAYERMAAEVHAEFAARSAALNKVGEVPKFFAVTSVGSGNDPFSRYVRDMQANARALAETSNPLLRDSLYEAGQAMQLPDELPHTHTVFRATGEDFLDAAHVMAEGYGELMFHSDDADTAVARALGASSLSGLAEAWNWALAQDTPLLAGQSMLRDLTTGSY